MNRIRIEAFPFNIPADGWELQFRHVTEGGEASGMFWLEAPPLPLPFDATLIGFAVDLMVVDHGSPEGIIEEMVILAGGEQLVADDAPHNAARQDCWSQTPERRLYGGGLWSQRWTDKTNGDKTNGTGSSWIKQTDKTNGTGLISADKTNGTGLISAVAKAGLRGALCR